MKKTTALTVTVLAIATLVGTPVAQSTYSLAQAPTSSVAQAKSSWENPKLLHTLPTIASYAKFSSNGLLLVCNGERGKAIQLWDVTKGELLSSIKGDDTTYFGDVAISPNRQFIASIIYSQNNKSIGVGLWNSKTGKAIWKKPIVTNSAEFPSQSDFDQTSVVSHVSSLEFSPNGQSIASSVQKTFGSKNPQIQLWNVATGKKRFVLKSNIESLRQLSFSPDSQVLASLGFNPDGAYNHKGMAQLWNPNTGKLLHTLKDNLIPHRMVFSPNGQTLTSLSKDSMMYDAHLRTWNVKTGRTLRDVPVGVDRTDYLLSLTPDAKTHLTSGQVAGTRMFNSQTGKNWGLPGANDVYTARTALFSPDGQRLAIPTATGIPIWQGFGN